VPELTNSRRVVYKATHVAVVPDVAGADAQAVAQISGGVPKAGQVQLLAIKKLELPVLRTAVKKLSLKRAERLAVNKALNAVTRVAKGGSRQVVLRNARAFARVEKSALAKVAEVLIANRRKRHSQLLETIDRIQKVYAANERLAGSFAKTTSKASPATARRLMATPQEAKLFGSILASNRRLRALAGTSGPAVALESVLGRAPQAASQPVVSLSTPRTPLDRLNNALRWAAEQRMPEYATLQKLAPPQGKVLRGFVFGTDQFTGTDVINAVNEAANEAAAASTFDETFHIEPVGRLFLERLETTPAGIERGELVYSIPMTPGEEVNISHREWSRQSEGFENIVSDRLEGYSEKGVTEKSDVSQAVSSESKHSTALNVGVSLSASYASVSLSSSFGYNSTSDDQQSKKDSRNHASEITSKAASRTRKDHKVTFKVASAAETEDLAVRRIKNEGTSAVRYDYFRIMRKWKVDLIRYGLRMTYDIVIPSPGSTLLQKIAQKKQIDAQLNEPMTFGLSPSGITRGTWVDLQTQWGAPISPPPEETMLVDRVKPFQAQDTENTEYDFIPLDIDPAYSIESATFGAVYDAANKPQHPEKPKDNSNSWFDVIGDGQGGSIGWQGYGGVLTNIQGLSGQLNVPFGFLKVTGGLAQIRATVRLRPEAFTEWQGKSYQQLLEGARNQDQLNRNRLREQAKQLQEEIDAIGGLAARQMEREEIMKGVLQWLLGPSFSLVPKDIQSWFTSAGPNDPLTFALSTQSSEISAAGRWQAVMEYGEFIKFIHNAIEWENVLYVNYPYFWDSPKNWDFKLFLNHVDPEHRMFLRSGAARVVLTIREGYGDSFTALMESGAMQTIPYLNTPDHPYRKISDEIRSAAMTNYPGIPPANPATNVRPLLYPEQTRTWQDMQYLIQLLEAYRADSADGTYPTTAEGIAALKPKMNKVNAANDLIGWPSYQTLPTKDFWDNDFVYKCPGDTGEYDLVSYGADGKPDAAPGGRDKNTDIWANAEGSVIATWFEYTPTSALDVQMTMNLTDMA